MGSLGPFEIIIIAIVLLLFFGAKRLPELARGIGKSLKEFKKATSDIQDEIESSVDNSDKYINHEDKTGYDHVRPDREKAEPKSKDYQEDEDTESKNKQE
ncbi:MAG: twin-arginine translocase TatA/TatE family subunit [Candidatus Marinimicrobia bacterium]|nr:twin-arginine translocase TatA/TatE family subunit [Candidatus Neomarinimicrobiota bacterium]